MSNSYHPHNNRKSTASYFSLERPCSLADKKSEQARENLAIFMTLLRCCTFFSSLCLSSSHSLPSSPLSALLVFSPPLLLLLKWHFCYRQSYTRTYNSMRWQGCGGTGPLIHCWWKYKMSQPLWGKVRQFLVKFKYASTIWASSSLF